MRSFSNKKAKIRWLCRRGMLELDILLQRFLDAKINNMTEQELNNFANLLNYPDPDIYAWLMGYEDPPADVANVVADIHNQMR